MLLTGPTRQPIAPSATRPTWRWRAVDYLARAFWDGQHGGVYWTIDKDARPIEPRKHSYAQAFAIYGLSEHCAATGDAESLRLARTLFDLLETHAHAHAHGGYIEGCGPDWGALADLRLSPKEPDCRPPTTGHRPPTTDHRPSSIVHRPSSIVHRLRSSVLRLRTLDTHSL